MAGLSHLPTTEENRLTVRAASKPSTRPRQLGPPLEKTTWLGARSGTQSVDQQALLKKPTVLFPQGPSILGKRSIGVASPQSWSGEEEERKEPSSCQSFQKAGMQGMPGLCQGLCHLTDSHGQFASASLLSAPIPSVRPFSSPFSDQTEHSVLGWANRGKVSTLLRLASIYPGSLLSSMPSAARTLPLPFRFLGPRYKYPGHTAHLVHGDRIHAPSRRERKLKHPRGWASLHSAPTVPQLGLSSTLQATRARYHLSGSCQSFYRPRFSKRQQRYL